MATAEIVTGIDFNKRITQKAPLGHFEKAFPVYDPAVIFGEAGGVGRGATIPPGNHHADGD